MAALSTDLSDPGARPYFLWSEDTTVGQLRAILADPQDLRRPAYLARLMREASLADLWTFATPADLAAAWLQVLPHLGRRRRFWEYLLSVWRKHGAI